MVDNLINRIGGYNQQRDPMVYKLFLDDFTTQRHEKALRSLMNFIDSGDFCFTKKHYNS